MPEWTRRLAPYPARKRAAVGDFEPSACRNMCEKKPRFVSESGPWCCQPRGSAVCDPGWTPRKLSLGVADIRKTVIVPEQPESTEVVFEVEIPQEQLAPVVIENFCLASDQGRAAEPAQLRLAGYMSAQAALRCATEAEEKVSYASRVFDVLLNCASQDVLTTDGDG